MKAFIIEHNNNNSYISALLVGLFYDHSKIDNLLVKPLENNNNIYLQEYIMHHFVNKIRSNKSIMSKTITQIDTISRYLGWNDNSLEKYFVFLSQAFENEYIEIKDNNEGLKSTIPYIPLELGNKNEYKLSELINKWLNNNNINTNESDSFIINNIPQFICLTLNRFNSFGNKLDNNVLISKRISILNNDLIYNTKWDFHSAICYKGDNISDGYYYTLFYYKDKWFLCDSNLIPCIREVKMDDPVITTNLKKDSIMLFYKLPSFLY